MFIIFGIIGLLIISTAIWLKNEKKQDFLFVIGGISLLIYSMSIHDLIFIILQIVFIISALVEIFRLPKKK
ncbi:MAG: YgjV family protein [Candidatus Paceibacterota bacterium]